MTNPTPREMEEENIYIRLVEAALKAAEDIFERRGGKMVNASWCCEAVRSLDPAAIVASVKEE